MKIGRTLDEYMLAKPGVTSDFKEEWQWERYMVGSKMFAAFMTPGDKHAAEYAGKNLINLKCEPMLSELLRKEHPGVIMPAFYSDKRCWISVDLDGGLPLDDIRGLIDDSYNLVFKKLTKKLQAQITQDAVTKP